MLTFLGRANSTNVSLKSNATPLHRKQMTMKNHMTSVQVQNMDNATFESQIARIIQEK